MPSQKKTIVYATRNSGKLKEIDFLLKDLPIQTKSLKDYPHIGEIVEDGSSFEENALIKARAVHRVTGTYVLADDSGLECFDLEGAPGIHSARFAGSSATDKENNEKLVAVLQMVHDPSRRAQYVCVLVLKSPDGSETLVRETCEGLITFKPGGTGGFGYDPYFFLPDKNCTMAELPLEEKNKISHRGKALGKMHAYLKKNFMC